MGSNRFTITPVTTDSLVNHWQTIRGDIRQVAKKSKVDYQPVDVLRELKSGRAMAALIEFNSNHLGTLIVRPLTEEFSNRKILHVWILAMSDTKINGSGDLLDQVWQYTRDMAEYLGSDLVQVISDRKGWERRLKKYGFKPCQFTAYHREIAHE